MSPAKKRAPSAKKRASDVRRQEDCPHPKDKRKWLGYAAICERCGKVNP